MSKSDLIVIIIEWPRRLKIYAEALETSYSVLAGSNFEDIFTILPEFNRENMQAMLFILDAGLVQDPIGVEKYFKLLKILNVTKAPILLQVNARRTPTELGPIERIYVDMSKQEMVELVEKNIR